jgi:tRNA A37 methylthiotransferase MiaB
MNGKNTLICSLNSQYIHSSLAPWCLLSGIRAYGSDKIRAEVYEGTINEKAEKTVNDIICAAPKYIGFCCYIWNIERIKAILPKIKKALPDSAVILGGPEVSYNQEQVLKEIPEADYIISGEGERPFPALLDALLLNEAIPKQLGISYRDTKKSSIVVSPAYISQEEPPSPYCDEYFQRLAGRISYIETSRGCPYSCAFCLSGRCGSARFFDLQKSLDEMTKLANSGTKTIKFVDRTFNANKARAKTIIKYICENYGSKLPNDCCFHFEIAGDILDEELIHLLNGAPTGSIQLEIGMQSFNEETLAAIDRKTNTDVLKNNIVSLIAPGNIHIHIDLIAGLPFEDMTSFRDSFNTAFALRANMLQMGFLKILHGAPMDVQKERFPCTYSEAPPYEVTTTPWLTADELAQLHLADHALDRIWCSGRFRDSADFLIKNLNVSPFDFFMEIGKLIENIKTPTDITAKLFEYCQLRLKDKASEFRDVLVTDWLSTNSSGKLPPSIMIHDPKLKKFIVSLEQNSSTRRKKGVKRSAAVLYSQRQYCYVDYTETDSMRDPVSGKYPLKFVKFKETEI